MVASVGNKLALSDIYLTPVVKLILNTQLHIYLQRIKLKHLVYVTQEAMTQVGSKQPRVVVVAPPENNGS